jgi:hypothetical protein
METVGVVEAETALESGAGAGAGASHAERAMVIAVSVKSLTMVKSGLTVELSGAHAGV